MKVILLQDIQGVGKKGQIIESSDGHARNYLLPRGMALEANKKNLNELELKQKSEDNKKKNELMAAQELKADIEKNVITMDIKAGASGKLFGSVTNKEIAQALEQQTGIVIEKKKIVLKKAVKSIGETQAEIKLHPKVTAILRVDIIESKE